MNLSPTESPGEAAWVPEASSRAVSFPTPSPNPSLCPGSYTEAPEFSALTSSDLTFPVSSRCPLSHPQRPSTDPQAHTGLLSCSAPRSGLFPGPAGLRPPQVTWSPQEVLADAAPCWAAEPWDKILPGPGATVGSTRLAGKTQDSRAPRVVHRPIARTPWWHDTSLLSDLGKTSVPAQGPCSHQNLSPQTSKHFSPLGSMLKCRIPSPPGRVWCSPPGEEPRKLHFNPC